MVDESIPSGARCHPLSHPSVLAFSIFRAHRVIRQLSSPSPSIRSAQDQQVVCDHPEAHPPLHPQEPLIRQRRRPWRRFRALMRPSQPVRHFSAARTARERPSRRCLGRTARRTPWSAAARIGGRGKAAIGDGQARGAAEQLRVPDQRGHPQRLIRHASLADRVVGDELGLRFLDLDQLAELRRFDGLALADRLRVRLEEAQQLGGVPGVSGGSAPGSERAPAGRTRWSRPVAARAPPPRTGRSRPRARARRRPGGRRPRPLGPPPGCGP